MQRSVSEHIAVLQSEGDLHWLALQGVSDGLAYIECALAVPPLAMCRHMRAPAHHVSRPCREQLGAGQTVQQALLSMASTFTHLPAGLSCLGALLKVAGCGYTQAQDADILQSMQSEHPLKALEVCAARLLQWPACWPMRANWQRSAGGRRRVSRAAGHAAGDLPARPAGVPVFGRRRGAAW